MEFGIIFANTGAYGAHALTVQGCTAGKTLPLYRANAYRFIMTTAYTNLPIGGAFRGYGGPQGFFAMEAHMDEVADLIGMDPAEFRRKNILRPGDENPLAKALGEGKEGPPQKIRSCGVHDFSNSPTAPLARSCANVARRPIPVNTATRVPGLHRRTSPNTARPPAWERTRRRGVPVSPRPAKSRQEVAPGASV